MAIPDFDVRMLKSGSSQADVGKTRTHAAMSQMLDQTGCHTSPASENEHGPFLSLSAPHV